MSRPRAHRALYILPLVFNHHKVLAAAAVAAATAVVVVEVVVVVAAPVAMEKADGEEGKKSKL